MATHQLSTYVDLDWAAEGADLSDAESILRTAEEGLVGQAGVNTGEPIVSLVTMDGPAGGNPVIRFTAQPDVIDVIVATYDAEAEG